MSQPFYHTRRDQSSKKVSNLMNILVSCLNLLNDQASLQVLQSLIEKCNSKEEINQEQKTVNHVHTKTRTNIHFRLNSNIGEFNMGDIILDLGSEVNVLPIKTWECIGGATLVYSTIQLKLEIQHRVIPIGQLK